jgi:hypothetical protein
MQNLPEDVDVEYRRFRPFNRFYFGSIVFFVGAVLGSLHAYFG